MLILQEFWNWSWDDLVKSDLPSMLQYVNNYSKQPVYYVGYSQVSFTLQYMNNLCDVTFVIGFKRFCC